MSDHGDDVAEFLLNRTFNQYTAKEAIRFILDTAKRRHKAKDLGLNSEKLGKNTLVYNSDYDSLKKLEGFEVEKVSSEQFASLKAHVIKNHYNINVMQIKDCLLIKSKDYAKVSAPSVRDEIEKTLIDISKDKNLIKDICTQASIDQKALEKEIFKNFPNGRGETTKERLTKRVVEASKTFKSKDKSKILNRQLANNLVK